MQQAAWRAITARLQYDLSAFVRAMLSGMRYDASLPLQTVLACNQAQLVCFRSNNSICQHAHNADYSVASLLYFCSINGLVLAVPLPDHAHVVQVLCRFVDCIKQLLGLTSLTLSCRDSMALLLALEHGEATVTELMAVVDIVLSTASHHLAILKRLDLVDRKFANKRWLSFGRSHYYR